jgi:hypothetical protein
LAQDPLAGIRDRNELKGLVKVQNGQLQRLCRLLRRVNVASYAEAGADIVVTSAPYLAKPKDVQVRITMADGSVCCLVA